MEKLLHYIWEHRLYLNNDLYTTTGFPVEVIDPGYRNSDAGPDFFNAKVKIGNRIWAGNIEIHQLASDWLRHNHHLDKTYDSVILHIVEKNDIQLFRTTGEPIPQLELRYDPRFRSEYEFLLQHDTPIPCLDRLYEIEPIFIADWVSSLAIERLLHKAERIDQWLKQYQGNWEEVCYIAFARTLGFGTNNDTFERLARSLPLIFMQKHADSLLQIEAFLFGQAGFLQERSSSDDKYYNELREEYHFLQHKFNLSPLSIEAWKFTRMRPANFPHQRIALLAQLIYKGFTLFSQICDASNETELRQVFQTRLQGYWDTHYNFGETSASRAKVLGQNATDILLINTVVPLLFAYSRQTGLQHFEERAFNVLENLKPEKNHIVSYFTDSGLTVQNALDSQALIQLHNEYCQRRQCLSCRIGHQLLTKKFQPI